MAQVSVPSGPYSRRVSFNNLHPDDLESGSSKFYHYNDSAATHHADLEVSKMFGNYSLGSMMSGSRKRVKLPDPPLKLILKNKLTPHQLLQNLQHAALLGVSYHGDLNDLAQADTEKLPIDLDLDDELLLPPPPAPSARRKSYSQMTDEELMALDPQFSKPRTSSLDGFKFDLSTMYYSNARRASTGGSLPSQAIPKQVVYPSLNENNYKLMSLTVRHQGYDVEPGTTRTLLTVVSGRKHTWNSLDWLLLTAPEDESGDESENGHNGQNGHNGLNGHDGHAGNGRSFLQDGDYLVVAGLVPLKFMEGCLDQKKQHCIDDKLYHKCDHLLQYILDNLPDKSLRLKITVEFVLDVAPSDPLAANYKKGQLTGPKFMLSHLFKQYQPTLVIIGNKLTNLNFKYPIRKGRQRSAVSPTPTLPIQLSKISLGQSQSSDQGPDAHLIKISSFLIKYSTVPLILVGNSTVFHHKSELKQSTAVTFSDTKPPTSRSILDIPPLQHRKDLATSDVSIESFNGNADSNSSSTLETPEELLDTIDDLQNSLSETRFADMLTSISLYSLAHSNNYLSVVNDDSVDRLSPQILNSKVHQVYSSIGHKNGSLSKSLSNGTAGKAYKVKSLISYSEEEEKKNEKMIHDKKLKKTASRGSVGSLKSSDDKKPKKKKSLFQKLGMKK